ncbi:hypothetical protein [Isoptericola cucumis]|uniref:Aromatic ring-opening dioxygenase LigA n=2 Tax=Isoptericola cucumis TaxID=1776856 RepID=A0ABQ2B808_9MICO|nr:hypothetical protein [Isoptericola cucumis]GGI09974.1 hypothetical protein GCM10007368_28930 [Isoptericola cucumis]
MSSTVTIRPTRGVRGVGMISIIAGILLIVAGAAVWIVVSQTLADEQITVSDDSTFLGGAFAGDRVAGPLSAYAQADVIAMHATGMADGQTYAQLPQDDPVREDVMNASFLRASLFTSVVAFGVCALVIGLGILFVLVGGALRGLAGGPQVAVETPGLSSRGDLSAGPRHADAPPQPAPQPAPHPGPPPSRPTTRATPQAPPATAGKTADGTSVMPPAPPAPPAGPGSDAPPPAAPGPRA